MHFLMEAAFRRRLQIAAVMGLVAMVGLAAGQIIKISEQRQGQGSSLAISDALIAVGFVGLFVYWTLVLRRLMSKDPPLSLTQEGIMVRSKLVARWADIKPSSFTLEKRSPLGIPTDRYTTLSFEGSGSRRQSVPIVGLEAKPEDILEQVRRMQQQQTQSAMNSMGGH